MMAAMTVRPYPSVARACHQLERHAQPEPEPVPHAEYLARFTAAVGVTTGQLAAGIAHFNEQLRDWRAAA